MLTVANKPIILSVVKLSVDVLDVVRLSVVRLSVVRLSVVRLSVVRLNAVVPMLWHQRNDEENLKINSPKIVFFHCSVAEAP
jgi:hypothetical protein